ncbi:hypothetical protein [Streptomyces sp. NPDC060322]|uniref:hypothetical protein n=1 Tax=Streptomyces sp. NPDC060322 TaxID=3347097 RepID=UPI00365D205F
MTVAGRMRGDLLTVAGRLGEKLVTVAGHPRGDRSPAVDRARSKPSPRAARP